MLVLVTGGAGFIGSALTARLLARGDCEVVCLDNLHPQVHGPQPVEPTFGHAEEFTFVRGDVTDPQIWDETLSRFTPDVVVHLAAETGTGQSLLQSARHSHVNVCGTATMMDALARTQRFPTAILLTSSRAVYGEGRWQDTTTGAFVYPTGRTEAALQAGQWEPTADGADALAFTPHDAAVVEPRPTNVYAATKQAQEQLLSAWCVSHGVGLPILRLQNVYGAGQAVGNPYTGVLTYFARQLAGGEPLNVYEGGGIVRDFVHVSDVVAAMVAALDRELDGSHSGDGPTVLDVGSGASGTLLDFARELAALVPGSSVEVTSQFRLGDVRAAYADITAARAELGYAPAVPFSAGAPELLEWVAEQTR